MRVTAQPTTSPTARQARLTITCTDCNTTHNLTLTTKDPAMPPLPPPELPDDWTEAAAQAALAELHRHALPEDAPGAWIRAAIRRRTETLPP